ncbi:MAG: hypothetical protein ACE10H_07735 [Candidatus Binatia bacterium]
MQTNSRLTLSAASTVVEEALAKRRDAGLFPSPAAVLDCGGNIIALDPEEQLIF